MRTMKARLILLLIVMSAGALNSCRNSEDSAEGLQITVPSKTTVLPVSMMSCSDTDPKSPSLAAGAFEFTDFKYQWAGKGTFTIAYVEVTLRSNFISGGTASCTLAADELESMLGASNPRSIAEGTVKEYTSSCTLRCGGVKFNDIYSQAFGTGTVTMFGTVKYSNGENDTAEASQDFSFEYRPKPK